VPSSGASWPTTPRIQRTNRFNDGRVDPRGRYLAGTVDEPKAGGTAGSIAVIGAVSRGLDLGFMTSNGLAFSSDGRTLYFSDTPRFVIFRYDYDLATGAASNRREFVRIEPTATDRRRRRRGGVLLVIAIRRLSGAQVRP
jgi:sugar lactone lactonase YvrE